MNEAELKDWAESKIANLTNAKIRKEQNRYILDFDSARTANFTISVDTSFTELPFSIENVKNDYTFYYTRLTTVKGVQDKVYGDFIVSYCRLVDCVGFPSHVLGSVHIDGNILKSLKGFPKRVGGNIRLTDNPDLTDFKDLPASITGMLCLDNTGFRSISQLPKMEVIRELHLGDDNYDLSGIHKHVGHMEHFVATDFEFSGLLSLLRVKFLKSIYIVHSKYNHINDLLGDIMNEYPTHESRNENIFDIQEVLIKGGIPPTQLT